MLRVDKITLCLLEEHLNSYLKDELNNIPTLKMLHTSIDELKKETTYVKNSLEDICKCEVINTQTLIGGGTTPNKKIPSIAITIEYKDYKPNKIEKLLRENGVISRIENEKVLFDFRSIQECELDEIIAIVRKVFK